MPPSARPHLNADGRRRLEKQLSFGGYPKISLKEACELRHRERTIPLPEIGLPL